MKKQFTIDFFDLLWLSESIIPPRPIARSMCFDELSDTHYHKMTNNERNQMFEHVQKCPGFNLENEQCRYFYDRFNPENQYLISYDLGIRKESGTIECFMNDGNYKTQRNISINTEFIADVNRIVMGNNHI